MENSQRFEARAEPGPDKRLLAEWLHGAWPDPPGLLSDPMLAGGGRHGNHG